MNVCTVLGVVIIQLATSNWGSMRRVASCCDVNLTWGDSPLVSCIF